MPTPIFLRFPISSAGKESLTCNVGDLGSIPGLGRSPREGNSYPLLYSGLENSIDCVVHGVAKSQTQLSDFHFTSLQIIGVPEKENKKKGYEKILEEIMVENFPKMGKERATRQSQTG